MVPLTAGLLIKANPRVNVIDERVPDYLAILENIRQQLYTLQSQFEQQVQTNILFQLNTLMAQLETSTCSHSHQSLINQLREVGKDWDLPAIQTFVQELQHEIAQESNDDPCYQTISVTVSTVSALISQIQLQVNQLISDPDAFTGDLSHIDQDKAYRYLIEPLGNAKRLAILFEIYGGRKRFKDLEEALNLSGGHLLYHLNPLKESGYVIQDANKNYVLGPKAVYFLKQLKTQYDVFIT